MKPSLFHDRDEVIQFILGQMKELNPNVHYETVPNTTDLEYNIWFTGLKEVNEVHTTMKLDAVMKAYEQSQDLNILIDFINHQVSLFGRIADVTVSRVKPDLTSTIIPIVRPADFSPYASKEVKELSDSISPDMKMFYAYHAQGKLEFIHEDAVPASFTPDTLVEKAFENLKNQGWLKHEQKHDGPGADLYIFEDRSDRQFHAQFFLGEWTKQHLGEEFYFAFPSQDTAFVMVPNKKGSVLFNGQLGGPQYALRSLASQVYNINPKGLSPMAYFSNKGQVTILQ